MKSSWCWETDFQVVRDWRGGCMHKKGYENEGAPNIL